MAGLHEPRRNVPQAFVSSYAPRLRAFQNALLTPIQPQTVIPPVRTTKRGTTAINYSEEFENDELEDSDAPRRTARVRRQPEEQGGDKLGPQKETSKELHAPVDVQAIWREWMGKPKRIMTEKQVQLQAALPLNLIPIRIDLNIAPFQPEAPLPKPSDIRERGLDENAPAYRLPDVTPEYRLKDYFLWNLHEALITPDQFAKVLVDDLDFPSERKQGLVNGIAQQIRTQLEEHASTELHPFFSRDKPLPTKTAPPPPTRPVLSREQSSALAASGTPAAAAGTSPLTNGTNGVNEINEDAHHVNGNGEAKVDPSLVSVMASPVDPVLNPDDSHRCVITISLNLQNRLLTDKFEWSLLHPPGVHETFAKQTCADLGLSGEWVPALAHSIYEAVLKLKKDVVENNGSILGVVGSGVNGWGEIENDAAEVHGDASVSVGEGAGWRFDQDMLGLEWEPKLEVLSKDDIEKREGDRERQLRRMRRTLAAHAGPQAQQRESFYGGIGEAGQDEERMGRGERAKKKRRFRSLSPNPRDTPDAAAFGGEAGKLSETERQTWRCAHCQVWGAAVWAVRDGPYGPRTLCNNCGLLYEQNQSLPPWSKDLYAGERDAGSNRPIPPASRSNFTPQPELPRVTRFEPNPARAHSQTFFRHSPSFTGSQPPSLSEQYAATVRGGGPQMFEDYAIDGEDLDWTKVTDPRERKRLQNIINGRKYRERRLAQDGVYGSEGSSPGPQPAPSGYGTPAPSSQSQGQGAGSGSFPFPGQGQYQINVNGSRDQMSVSTPAAQGQGQTNMGGTHGQA